MAVTDRRNGRAATFRFRRRALGRFHLGRMIERAGEFEINMAAPERAVPAFSGERGDALHEARGHGRAAGDLGGAAQDDFRGAQALRKIVRGKADAALGRIEAEIAAHRAAEPGIVARLGRPGALVEAAQHHAVDGLQARFQRPKDTHAHVVRFPGGAPRGRRSRRGTARHSRLSRRQARRLTGSRQVPRRRG